MIDRQMQLLNRNGRVGRDADGDIHPCRHRSSGTPGQGDCMHSQGPRHLNRVEYVPRVSRRTDSQKRISFTAQAVDLLGEDVIGSVIIDNGSEQGMVSTERNGGKRPLKARRQMRTNLLTSAGKSFLHWGRETTWSKKPFHQFPDDMIAVRRAAAITAHEQLSARGESSTQHRERLHQRPGAFVQGGIPLYNL